ncbi:synaptotagmin-5-like [Convolutriloba macropyga]|uniref:synaptotagmin-5-like n=1 Tax=Convolutriloba macropyga TaxID=536237 RepID=UPI003F51BCB3
MKKHSPHKRGGRYKHHGINSHPNNEREDFPRQAIRDEAIITRDGSNNQGNNQVSNQIDNQVDNQINDAQASSNGTTTLEPLTSTVTITGNASQTNLTSGGSKSDEGFLATNGGIAIVVILVISAALLVTIIVFYFIFRWYKKRQLRENLKENYLTRMKGKKKLGTVEYILQYNYLEARLTIEILRVKDITLSANQETDMKEFATYMRIYLVPDMDQVHETKIVTKTLDPNFGQTFIFKLLVDDIDRCRILLRLYQHHKFLRDMPIGDGIVELLKDELRLGFATVPMYAYNPALDDPLGEICLSLRYNPVTSKLSVTIIECKNLKPMDWNGKADPYVKISIKIREKVVYKEKTTIQKNTLNPYFNTIFSFKIAPTKIPLVDLLIVVKDYDLLGANEEIGSVRLGIEPDSEGAERQWNNMIENLKRPQTEWHHLMPSERATFQ